MMTGIATYQGHDLHESTAIIIAPDDFTAQNGSINMYWARTNGPPAASLTALKLYPRHVLQGA